MATQSKPKVNLSLLKIDESIATCRLIIASLQGSEGAIIFRAAQKEIETNLEGEYADALSNSVLKSKESYLDSLSNVTALKDVLIEYKKYLRNGSNGKLRNNGDEIKIDMDQIYKQIRNLEDTITTEGNLKKVLESDYDFDTWQSVYTKSLNDSWMKTYEVDESGNMTEAGILAHLADKHKEDVFKTNKANLIELDATLAGGLVTTTSIITELEAISGLLSGELSDFSAIWNVFDFSKADYQKFLAAQYENMPDSKLFNKLENSNLDFEALSDLFASLCINYDGTRFKLSSDVYGVEDAIKKLEELGYSEDEALVIFSIVNMQHVEKNSFEEYLEYLRTQFYAKNGMIDNGIYTSKQCAYLLEWYEKNYIYCETLFNNILPYKDLDIAHMMLAISVQLDNKPKGLLFDFGLEGYRNEYFNWKGDVESARMGPDDITADINAYVIANMYKENGHFNKDDAFQYVTDIQTGKLNPVDEFLKIYGNGDIQEGYDKVVEELNDLSSGTVVINESMTKGVEATLAHIFGQTNENFTFEKYFADDLDVQKAYIRFTVYLKQNSSIKELFSAEDLYEKK